mmetsp:Transcript_27718/g.78421  ORF Transcript_27718/g.78421 Transcript_27718/m.78421 type:complete len:592 (-) Transcript_27718:459-2234(-)
MGSDSEALLEECLAACKAAAAVVAAAPADGEGQTEGSLLCQSVVASMGESVVYTLSDYHHTLNTPGASLSKMDGLLQILQGLSPGQDRLVELVRGMVSSSVARELQRLVDKHPTTTANSLLAVAQGLVGIIKMDDEQFVPVLEAYLPDPWRVTAETLHSEFGVTLRGFFEAEKNLQLDTIPCTMADFCDRLDSALLRRMEEPFLGELRLVPVDNLEGSPEPPGSWDVMGAVQDALVAWVDKTTSVLPQWSRNAIAKETWMPSKNEGGSQIADSCQDILRMLHTNQEQLFALGLRLPAEILAVVADAQAQCVREFCSSAVAGLEWERFVPPVPQLTRFKETNISKAQRKEHSAATASSMSARPSQPEGDGAPELVPPIPALKDWHTSAPQTSYLCTVPSPQLTKAGSFDGAITDCANMPAAQITLRLNTLAHLKDCIPDFMEEIRQKWRPYGSLEAAAASPASVGPLFENAFEALEHAMDRVLQFISAKVVFVDLRVNIFGNLYRWDVRQSRMRQVLGRLDDVIYDIVSRVEEDDLQNRCAVHILRGCVQGVLRVLLDGGEPRVFASHDAALIQDDIDSHLKVHTFPWPNEG